MQQSADEVMKITMELGGKSPFIVFNVAIVEWCDDLEIPQQRSNLRLRKSDLRTIRSL